MNSLWYFCLPSSSSIHIKGENKENLTFFLRIFKYKINLRGISWQITAIDVDTPRDRDRENEAPTAKPSVRLWIPSQNIKLNYYFF